MINIFKNIKGVGWVFVATGLCAFYDGIEMLFYPMAIFELYGMSHSDGGIVICQMMGVFYLGVAAMLWLLAPISLENVVKWRVATMSCILDATMALFFFVKLQEGSFENEVNILFIIFLYLSMSVAYAYFLIRHYISKNDNIVVKDY